MAGQALKGRDISFLYGVIAERDWRFQSFWLI